MVEFGGEVLALLPLSVSDEREVPEMVAVFLDEVVRDSGGDLAACCVDEEGSDFDLWGLEEREGVLCEAEDEGAGEGVLDFWDARVEHWVSAVHGFDPGTVGHVPFERAERDCCLFPVPETRHCCEEGEVEHFRVAPV